MSLPIQKPYPSPSLFKRFTPGRNSSSISASEVHILHDLRSEAVTAASITLDGNEGEIRVELFDKVTDLTLTLINAPSLTTIATALEQFPRTLFLRINITPKTEVDSKKILKRRRRAERRTLAAPKDLSEILPQLTALYLTGWHDDICEWICSTTSGAIQWLDIIECGRSYAAPREVELIQRLLDNNKWVYSMKLITFYPLKLNLSHLVELASVQITVAPHSESVTRTTVATIPESLKCAVMLVEPRVVDLKNKALDHAEAMKRPTSDWSIELLVYGWG